MARAFSADSFALGTFLRRLPDAVRDRLLALGTTVEFQPGHTLMRQDEDDGPVFLLLKSVTKVMARAENGAEVLLAIRLSGDIVGEMAPLSHGARSATVITCGASVVSVIRGAVFLDFMHQHAAVGVALSRLMAERLRWANERRLDFAGYDTGVCLARLLLTLAERHGSSTEEGLDLGIALTQAELGGLVGAKEGTIQKAMRGLRGHGFIHHHRQRIIITDPQGLAAFGNLPIPFNPY